MSTATQMYLFEPLPVLPIAACPPDFIPATLSTQSSLKERTAIAAQGIALSDAAASRPGSSGNVKNSSRGVCRFCGWSGELLHDRNGEPREWADEAHTVCSGELCLARLARLSSEPKPAARRPIVPVRSIGCSCAVCSGRARGRCRGYGRR